MQGREKSGPGILRRLSVMRSVGVWPLVSPAPCEWAAGVNNLKEEGLLVSAEPARSHSAFGDHGVHSPAHPGDIPSPS